jgi:hypothetical protein
METALKSDKGCPMIGKRRLQPTLALHLLRRCCLSPCVIDPHNAIADRPAFLQARRP